MYYLPPLNYNESLDMELLLSYLRKKGLYESRYAGITEALELQIRGKHSWSEGEYDERRKHLRKIGHIYHPDAWGEYPDAIELFQTLMKSINAEVERIDNGTEPDYTEKTQGFEPATRFTNRFQRKDVTGTVKNVHPIEVHVTLADLYNKNQVHIPEIDFALTCNGDINDGSHRILKGRQIIFRVKSEMGAEKHGLDYIVYVQTNPIQLLYSTHKITLPNSDVIQIKPDEPLTRADLGFTGREGVGNLIVKYKIAKMPTLSKETKAQLHAINMAVFYGKRYPVTEDD